jgi:hypothetical protein
MKYNSHKKASCPHKQRANKLLAGELKKRFVGEPRVLTALVLDDQDYGTSRALLRAVPRRRGAGLRVTVPNPAGGKFPALEGVTVVRSTVERYVAGLRDERYDLVYLDYCASFHTTWDTIERVARRHLRPGGVIAWTHCNRALTLQEIALNQLTARESFPPEAPPARRAYTHVASVCYGNMATTILGSGPEGAKIVCDKRQQQQQQQQQARGGQRGDGVFLIERLVSWRMMGPGGNLAFKVRWAGFTDDDDTWEDAEHLMREVDRETWNHLVWSM